MATLLLDTNIVSYRMIARDPIATMYEPHLRGHTLAIAAATYGELLYGASVRRWGARRLQRLEVELGRYHIEAADADVACQWVRLRVASRGLGRELRGPDAWVAATACARGWPLVTHDRDFVGLPGLVIIQASGH